jgi:non-specific serine/threonine protein kinase/serine/threonine-protein kinase
MTPERWQWINDLFAEAHRQPVAERAAFLHEACAGEGSLEAAVAALLDQDNQAERDGFLSVPCPLRQELQASRSQPAATGRRVGNYILHERLGSGGMGEVYRATRVEEFSQEVALKWMKNGVGAESVERFRTERQVLAGLNHPHIARLLDGGRTEDGIPYLVMEYIDGEPIDRWCDARHVDVAGRVRLVEVVCRAVQYAHDRQVIHRDLKPDNVLVAADGVPKLTDFGLAKHLAEDHGCTQSGAILGTPSYMAPEQAAGGTKDVGPAADVYALGALLYHLLAGRAPFKGASVRETIEQVSTRDPVPPSRLQPNLPRDLETITLKCLEKTPQRRYASPDALAADLRRFLAGEPIQARPVGRVERFLRWRRRNPGIFRLTAALAVVVGGAFAAVTALWLQARVEKREADRQHERAEAHAKMAWDAVDDLTRLAEGHLAQEPRMTTKQLELLEKALAYRLQFLHEHPSDALVRFRTAQAFHFVGRLHNRMGKPVGAVEAFHRQIALLDELATEFPGEPKYRFDQFHCLNMTSAALIQLSRSSESRAVQRRALAIIRDLTNDFPQEPFYRDALAHQVANVAGVYRQEGDQETAARMYRESRDIGTALMREFPGRRDPPAYSCNIHRGLLGLAEMAWSAGSLVEAEKQYREALAVMRQVVADYPTEPDYRVCVVTTANMLARVRIRLGRSDEAEADFRSALAEAEKLVQDYPRVVPYHSSRTTTLLYLAHLYWSTGKLPEAERTYRQARDHLAQMVEDFRDYPLAPASLASLLTSCPIQALRDPPRAVVLAKRAVELVPEEIAYKIALGVAAYRSGDYRTAREVLEPYSQGVSGDSFTPRLFLAMAQWQLAKQEEARRLYRDAVRDGHLLLETSPEHELLRKEAEELFGISKPAPTSSPGARRE